MSIPDKGNGVAVIAAAESHETQSEPYDKSDRTHHNQSASIAGTLHHRRGIADALDDEGSTVRTEARTRRYRGCTGGTHAYLIGQVHPRIEYPIRNLQQDPVDYVCTPER